MISNPSMCCLWVSSPVVDEELCIDGELEIDHWHACTRTTPPPPAARHGFGFALTRRYTEFSTWLQLIPPVAPDLHLSRPPSACL